MPKLSIIIPCYNCEKTLKEAVDSCYTQGFSENEFEIVLVDDGSIDNTRNLIEVIASEYKNIRLFFHGKNKGGGATRNTAVEHSKSEVIFCLDSDDILPPNTLKKMYTHLSEKNCDGVGINKSIKFIGNDVKNISTVHIFNRVNERIQLTDLLQTDGLCSLYSTFMFTKEAFRKIKGYPIEHGFDTQGFAWRFLATELHAETCPDASYLHRVQFHESYYLREFNHGKVNFNWRGVFIDQLQLFTYEAQLFIMAFNCQDFTRDIFSELVAKGNIFASTPGLKVTLSSDATNQKPTPRNSLKGLYFRFCHRIRLWLKKNLLIKNILLKFLFFYQDITARMKAVNSLNLIFSYLILRCKKILKYDFNLECSKNNKQEMIDVVIPTIGKDFVLFNIYLQYLKTNICDNIENIYVVAPANEEKLIEYCTQNNLIFIDETKVLGYGKNVIKYTHKEFDRSGWLFQQLLKLSGEKIVKNNKYIIVDSDTLLIHKHQFLDNERSVFFQSTEWNEPYFRSFKNLFGYEAPHHLSLTSHMMIFDTSMLKEMKKEIEEKHHVSWDKAYINVCDKTVASGISDYDTYAQWMIYNYPDKVYLKPFYNKSLNRNDFNMCDLPKNKFGGECNTISLHSYN